jgi:hypothetical protein
MRGRPAEAGQPPGGKPLRPSQRSKLVDYVDSLGLRAHQPNPKEAQRGGDRAGRHALKAIDPVAEPLPGPRLAARLRDQPRVLVPGIDRLHAAGADRQRLHRGLRCQHDRSAGRVGDDPLRLPERPWRNPPDRIAREMVVRVARDRVPVGRDQQAGEEGRRHRACRHLAGGPRPAGSWDRRRQSHQQAGEGRDRDHPQEPLQWRANADDPGDVVGEMRGQGHRRDRDRGRGDQRRGPVAHQPGPEPQGEPPDHGHRPGAEEESPGLRWRNGEQDLEAARRRVSGADVARQQGDGSRTRERRQGAVAALEEQGHRRGEEDQRHDERGACGQAHGGHRRDRGHRRGASVPAAHPAGQVDVHRGYEPRDEHGLALGEARDEVGAEREVVRAVEEQKYERSPETDERATRGPTAHEPPEPPDREHGEDRRQQVVGHRSGGHAG